MFETALHAPELPMRKFPKKFFYRVDLLSSEISTEPDRLAALAVADTQLRAHAGLEALLKGFFMLFIYRIIELNCCIV
jgi:hypothetical protein